MSQIFDTVLINPILNLLIAFYQGFIYLGVPYAFGFAIMLLTLVIRALTSPLIHSQMYMAHKMAQLKPKLDELSQKHKDDKQKLQQEHMRLYQEEGVNPMGGCLPLLLQLPIFIALFNVFSKTLQNGNGQAALETFNTKLYFPWMKIVNLDLSFFGIDLTLKPSQWQTAGMWLLLIPIVTALLQYFQTKQMIAKNPPKKPTDKPQEEDTAAAVQKQMAFISPFMFGMISYSFPVGLALYWNIFTVFGILQQHSFNKKHGRKN